ncbi:hypothetical protein [Bacillus cereus group sp. MYBK35-2]|uniref:hypothetical protein n=1 Tax=unclassified Bacillus cereus group TaxID=2750818 RepID=UPI0029E85B37|nr:hypothetical protein [Bacillus cereus]MDA2314624.1 hypothetical protein [Bacillus cereus]MDA2499384.1 hypothetical protein [Bacillus cereus]
MSQTQSIQVFLGIPQTVKLPVYEVNPGMQVTIKQMIVTNKEVTDAKFTVTVNTVDIIKDRIIEAGKTEVIDMFVVLNQNDRLSLQQERENAINIMVNGVLEPLYQ